MPLAVLNTTAKAVALQLINNFTINPCDAMPAKYSVTLNEHSVTFK
jgi:hypothetical protein